MYLCVQMVYVDKPCQRVCLRLCVLLDGVNVCLLQLG